MKKLNPPDYVLRCAEAKDFGPLVWRLRNGMELTEAERAFIADYLEGKRGSIGRGSSPRKDWNSAKHFELFYWLTEHEGSQKDHAYDEVARLHRISRRTAIDAVKMARQNGHAERIEREDKRLRAAILDSDNQKVIAAIQEILETRRRRLLNGENLQTAERF